MLYLPLFCKIHGNSETVKIELTTCASINRIFASGFVKKQHNTHTMIQISTSITTQRAKAA